MDYMRGTVDTIIVRVIPKETNPNGDERTLMCASRIERTIS